MNNAQRKHYQREFERRRLQIEKNWKGKVFKALQGQVEAYMASWRDKGHLDTVYPISEIGTVIKALYIKSAVREAGLTYGSLRKYTEKLSGFGFNDEWTREVLRYFELHLLNKAVIPITETTKRMINRILAEGTAEGWSAQRMVEEMEKRTTDLNRRRARLITRTESVRAMNYGSLLGGNKSNLVLEKEWITARDERTRRFPRDKADHLRLHGERADFEGVFANGLSFPGDPVGSAAEVCNCRCTVALVPKRDQNGNVIRKPKVPLRTENRMMTEFINEALEELLENAVENLVENL